MKPAIRMDRIGTETAFEAAARARALEATGRSVIHLELGEPDFDTPRHVGEAAVRGLLDDRMTHYTPATGIAPLKQAIVGEVKRWKGIETTPDNVIVTPGAKPIMFYALLALIDQGDEVIYPDPGFPIYESMTRVAGGTPKPYALREENDFRLDVDELRSLVSDRTKLIIFNSPHNPTGGVTSEEDLKQIAGLVRAGVVQRREVLPRARVLESGPRRDRGLAHGALPSGVEAGKRPPLHPVLHPGDAAVGPGPRRGLRRHRALTPGPAGTGRSPSTVAT